MPGRVVLHIGAMKTGTSFIQSVVGNNQDLLAERGTVFLGGKFGVQSRAVHDILNLPQRPKKNVRRWRRLVRPVAEMQSGTALVSMEFLSFAQDHHVRRFLKPLHGSQIEVIVTVRDQFRVIPAQWQTYTRNFGNESWSDYLRHIEPSRNPRTVRSRAHKTFHRAQDLGPVFERWSNAPGVSKFHVVTVPPSTAPRDELWTRFCAAAGIDGDGADLDGVNDNSSLGYGSCEFLRRVNPYLADVRPNAYRSRMRAMARAALVPLRAEESRPVLDRRGAEYARTLNEELREMMSDSRFDLYGDLAELPVPQDLSDFARKAAPAPENEVRRAAGAALDHLATTAGLEVERPAKLDDLIESAAKALRRANGWES